MQGLLRHIYVEAYCLQISLRGDSFWKLGVIFFKFIGKVSFGVDFASMLLGGIEAPGKMTCAGYI